MIATVTATPDTTQITLNNFPSLRETQCKAPKKSGSPVMQSGHPLQKIFHATACRNLEAGGGTCWPRVLALPQLGSPIPERMATVHVHHRANRANEHESRGDDFGRCLHIRSLILQ